ncbi:hypothetical protein EYC80_002874 [Monilinia laxa]|uniref:Uncharacterized protein n=1 Tax=Monilinia laxa TaxID=61186 RepID=A0A5N6KBY4_MONLA|nr:hypothetical protein EYC80_002874 [Monilinia laxa]
MAPPTFPFSTYNSITIDVNPANGSPEYPVIAFRTSIFEIPDNAQEEYQQWLRVLGNFRYWISQWFCFAHVYQGIDILFSRIKRVPLPT